MPDGLKFSHKHYVPILKTKEGERWALSHLPPAMRRLVTPLLEIHPPKKPRTTPAPSKAKKPRPPKPPKTLKDHVGGICEALSVDWGPDHPLFVDTKWVDRADDGTVIADAFASLRACGMQAIPVVRLGHTAKGFAALRAAVSADGRGCLLRLAPDELGSIHIDAAVRALGLRRDQVHLLIDYRHRTPDIVDDIARVPGLAEWATLTVASNAMLGTFKEEKMHEWLRVPRSDWTAWRDALDDDDLQRKPAFSDYTCRDCGAPASGGYPSVNIRYACDSDWLVWVGSQVRYADDREMNKVCNDLIGRPEFKTRDFSAGDAEIHETAQPEAPGPGNPGQWVGWGVSHHLVFTCDQMIRLPDA
ncbi:MAG TPA: hypothetical protein VK324_06160 [Tepidisphaeraceae bacterium]|nr:hypothetical protein [Tepidisphaeraceae bacterium]